MRPILPATTKLLKFSGARAWIAAACAAAAVLTAGAAFAQDAVTPGAAAAPSTSGAKNQAATIRFVSGTVTLYDAVKMSREALVDGILNEGDAIVTGADGELHLDMQDGGFISVRPNTKM